MSVLIKGMEMPKSCLICVCDIPKGNCDLWRNQTPEEHRRERHPDCPLVEVPTPHGRLIDAESLEEETQKRILICSKNDNQFQKPYEIMRAIALAPTIIESEGD